MTTYILQGGGTSQDDPQNENFFRQFAELVNKDEVTVLLCYLARKKERWNDLIEKHTDYIKKGTQKSVTILNAENTDDLLKKIDSADVLYIASGYSELLEPLYNDLIDLPKKLEGKVYAGSSMGAFAASCQYVLSFESQDSPVAHKGLGLLPIQVLCHWDKEVKKDAKLQLLHNSSKLPIIVLNELEYAIFYA